MHLPLPKSIKQVKQFLQVKKADEKIKCKAEDKKECYKFIKQVTWKLKYKQLSKRDKGFVKQYLNLILGYSDIHTKRLINKAIKGKLYSPKITKNLNSFQKKYTREDIMLLAKLDYVSNHANGNTLKAYIIRMYNQFKNEKYKRLQNISVAHIYNLKRTKIYAKVSKKYIGTKSEAKGLYIGIREKPRPQNKPGFLRVDTVHGGDKDGKKGVYYLNIVDEVTQYENVYCVEAITERFLEPIWNDLSVSFPFDIINFHSDNGSEFINHILADLLNKVGIRQTKSRPRHHNDNGLVEGKNGAIIRKTFGYMHIPAVLAPKMQSFLTSNFNDYLNYHRPCAFPTKIIQPDNKVKICYKSKDYKTPYEKLKEIDPKGKYLRKGITYDILDKLAYAVNDFDYLQNMNQNYEILFKELISDPLNFKPS